MTQTLNSASSADDEKITVFLSLLLLIASLALVIGFYARDEFAYVPQPVAGLKPPTIDPKVDPKGHADQLRLEQIAVRFEQATAMLHAKRYDFAVTALHRVLELSPNLPEAQVNMGFALLGLKKYKAAGDFFASAIRLNSFQGNAYWGLAIALEQLGDKRAALGAMRTYVHLAKPEDPFVRRARAALWEWDNELKHGPRPKEEQAWVEQRGKEWEQRNRADVDLPPANPSVDLLNQK